MNTEESKTVRHGMPGRPPRSPRNKVGIPVRCLVTIGVQQAVQQAAENSGVNMSDFLRLCIFRQLESMQLMSPELQKDATWDTLRGYGRL